MGDIYAYDPPLTPADPLPDDLPEGDSGEVDDVDVPEPVFDPYDLEDIHGIPPELERGLADANAGRIVTRPLHSDELDDQASSQFDEFDEEGNDDDA